MTTLRITIGSLAFIARMEEAAAPATCAAFKRLLPFHNKIIQARWSGEAAWIPFGVEIDWEALEPLRIRTGTLES